MRGAPGNSVNHPTSYWVPDHTVRTFVEQVDVVSGVGYARAAAGRCRGHPLPRHPPRRLQPRRLRLRDARAHHAAALASTPGVTVDEIVAATAFALVIPDDVAETRLPTPEELDLMRTVLDPEALRDREVRS